ncbi:MAG: hypothetical protein H0V17_00250 [Deltaproteobacteria bacterium]|nr:hypothetical protein [Deltaproteobacteria bacterium]
MKIQRAALVALILTTTTFGCASKADQVETTPSSAGSPAKGDTEAPRPRTENEQMQDKLTEAESARGEAKVLAQNEKEKADAELVKTHKVTQDKLQSDFDAADRRFNSLKEKAGKATGAKKQKATTAIADITKQQAAVMASIAKLRDATLPSWDAAKLEVDTNLATFDKSITALETTLQ